MKKIKSIMKLTALFGIFFSWFLLKPVYADEMDTKQPEIKGSYGVSIDTHSGEVLYDKNSNEKAYPASVTKVMTALLLVENVKEDEEITISNFCINKERSNSQILFKEGEKMDRDTALYTMMTISANDIACAIGEHISGSEESFAKLMTERAKELGAVNTQFKNSNGLHDPEHYTTAYDLALIGKEAISHEEIIDAMGKKEYKVTTSKQADKTVKNPSKIHNDPDTLGGKTGYTNKARNTLMKIDEVDGKRVINVILGNNNLVNKNNIYVDIKNVSNYAIEKLQKILVIDETKWDKKLTIDEKEVLVIPETSIYLTENKTSESSYVTKFVPSKINKQDLYTKGIKKGQKLGDIIVKKDGKEVKKVAGISAANVTFEEPSEVSFPRWLKVLFAIMLPIVVYTGFLLIHNYRYFSNKKRPV